MPGVRPWQVMTGLFVSAAWWCVQSPPPWAVFMPSSYWPPERSCIQTVCVIVLWVFHRSLFVGLGMREASNHGKHRISTSLAFRPISLGLQAVCSPCWPPERSCTQTLPVIGTGVRVQGVTNSVLLGTMTSTYPASGPASLRLQAVRGAGLRGPAAPCAGHVWSTKPKQSPRP